jgi:hypothetical protein
MKKSGSVNVTMAKRAVRQRITWARQWTGLLFSRNNSTDKSGNGNKEKVKTLPAALQRKQTASSIGSVTMLRTNSSPAEVKPPGTPLPSSTSNAGGGRFSSFGKALFRHKSSKGSPNMTPSSAIPETLKVDTKKVTRNNIVKGPDVETTVLSPRVQKSLSEVSLPMLSASQSLDEITKLDGAEVATAPDVTNAATKAAKRISSSF